jgi:hypothetical protein
MAPRNHDLLGPGSGLYGHQALLQDIDLYSNQIVFYAALASISF